MTHSVWRIGTDTPDYTAEDLDGKGAKKTGGRWNSVGLPVVYTAESRALACLETLVHFEAEGLPLNRYLVRIDVPDDVWASARVETVSTLPIGWDAEPPGLDSIKYGSDRLTSRTSCLLRTPSVIVPEEENILINPTHRDHGRLTATKVRKWLYDPRLHRSDR